MQLLNPHFSLDPQELQLVLPESLPIAPQSSQIGNALQMVKKHLEATESMGGQMKVHIHAAWS